MYKDWNDLHHELQNYDFRDGKTASSSGKYKIVKTWQNAIWRRNFIELHVNHRWFLCTRIRGWLP